MSKRAPLLYLEDIVLAIGKIESYTTDLTANEFYNREVTIDAVVRNLEIIGEAAKNIPKTITVEYPNIPWEKMVSMRNKVIHEYINVDEEILWKTIQEDLPLLKMQISELLKLLNS